VDLHALGGVKAKDPGSTRRLRPSTAVVAPYLFVSPIASIALAIRPRLLPGLHAYMYAR
jgi:hypothetical protein